jgi:hypothetical protein
MPSGNPSFKQINGGSHFLFRYGTGGTGPRPESYREDVEFGDRFEDPADKGSIL